jgi:ribulose-phosphate 3-epimerase
MNEIIPAILPRTFEDLSGTLARLRGVPLTVQLDICDGFFVPERTWPMSPSDRAHFAEILKGDEGLPYWQDFNFEVDLMVHAPEKFVPQWIAAGVSRIVVHLESRHEWHEVRDAAGDSVEVGLAIDLDPPYEKLAAYVPRVDYLQVMGIARLGRQGENLDDRVFGLVERIRKDFPDVTIQVDGGVAGSDIARLVEAGATRLVSGSYILSAEDPRTAVQTIRDHAHIAR